MPITIPLDARASMYAERTGNYPIGLFDFSHPDMVGITRVCTSGVTRISDSPYILGLTSNGEDYIYVPMSVQLPDDVEGRASNAKIMIENVSRDMLTFVRTVTTPGLCDISIVMSDDLDTIVRAYPTLDLRSAGWNSELITFELGLDAMDTEPIPSDSFNPATFPGLF